MRMLSLRKFARANDLRVKEETRKKWQLCTQCDKKEIVLSAHLMHNMLVSLFRKRSEKKYSEEI